MWGWLLAAGSMLSAFPDSGGKKDVPNNFVSSKSGGQLKIGGTVKQDFVFSGRSLFLNGNVKADKYQYIKHVIDLDLDYNSDAQAPEDSSIDLHATIRHKSYWGNPTDSFKTGSSEVFSGTGTSIGSHSHDVSKPGLWLKDLWMKARVDKIFKKDLGDKNCLDLTVGFFPFQAGRGISLGGGYGTPKDFLGIYNRINDFNAPGALLHGAAFQGMLTFDAYYSKFESKSSSPKQTLASKREKIIGNRLTPWAGSGNDDNLFALQLKRQFNEFTDPLGNALSGSVLGYALYNNAPGKKVEFDFDSESDLFTFGAGLEGKSGNFEFGFEGAINLGDEKLHSIDRNGIKSVRTDNGGYVDQYSHIEKESSPGSGVWSPALVTKALSQELATNQHQANGRQFTAGGDSFRSSSSRIRPQYTNRYRGRMFIIDGAYTFKGERGVAKPAFAFGYASGDRDPNIAGDNEVDKEYKGFIGLNELYSGSRVKSIIMLDDRSVRRPMTISRQDRVDRAKQKSDGTFTDIKFIGGAVGFKPSIGEKMCEKVNLGIDFNVLGFWKDHRSKAIEFNDLDQPLVSDKDARRFLGLEFNAIVKFEPIKNLFFTFSGAAFMPGGYYKDIAGARIKDDAMTVFEQSDLQKIPSKAYAIGSDTSYYLASNITYKF